MTDQIPLFDFSDDAQDLTPDQMTVVLALVALLDPTGKQAHPTERNFLTPLLTVLFQLWHVMGAEIAERRGYRNPKQMLEQATLPELRTLLIETFLALLPMSQRPATIARLCKAMGLDMEQFRKAAKEPGEC